MENAELETRKLFTTENGTRVRALEFLLRILYCAMCVIISLIHIRAAIREYDIHFYESLKRADESIDTKYNQCLKDVLS